MKFGTINFPQHFFGLKSWSRSRIRHLDYSWSRGSKWNGSETLVVSCLSRGLGLRLDYFLFCSPSLPCWKFWRILLLKVGPRVIIMFSGCFRENRAGIKRFRTVGIQERTDSGLEWFRTGGKQEMRDSGLEGFKTGGILKGGYPETMLNRRYIKKIEL